MTIAAEGPNLLEVQLEPRPPFDPSEPRVDYDSVKMGPIRSVRTGLPIEFSQQALDRGARGTVIADCVLDRRGEVRACSIVQSVPLLDSIVLPALESRAYEPLLLDGVAVNVNYRFEVTMSMR